MVIRIIFGRSHVAVLRNGGLACVNKAREFLQNRLPASDLIVVRILIRVCPKKGNLNPNGQAIGKLVGRDVMRSEGSRARAYAQLEQIKTFLENE